ncbi:response regulator receiver modulated CheB methylesterase [Magnetococcus marinus MC-1]|uniref:Protein-glutamate methylesterase/protein-glutamine glutaminase n=1 Tax=Magnetococcus marinus (strain ATCC BAA-1437 / JCM 17883 / MC-1) TaxID=156889 RepID=A0L7P6_MAGMM|nr:chemotaxis-specific protein-glutamate methyltransferase CheB [Magnetococcus marinus]ABK43989.1 response regulator receiver modulated CheB methylesterase [Magnetococcus marinus MC-1]
METVRVLVVDDSPSIRALIKALLADEVGVEVVAEACNGQQAVELNATLLPDIITMDLEMPVMTGIQAIGEIMRTRAVPILVVSSVSDAEIAYQAVRHGALEVTGKPTLHDGEELAEKLRLLAGVPVIRHIGIGQQLPSSVDKLLLPQEDLPAPTWLPVAEHHESEVPQPVYVIASSTGGPNALALLIAALPQGFPYTVLIAQHISDGFAAGMVEWLGQLSAVPVRLGKHGEPILPGVVYIAPSEFHMTVTADGRIAMLTPAEGDIYHPSCDALLRSAAAVYGSRVVGVILTGMGRDGVQGLAAVCQAGGKTLAQDEASSVIFGMNKLAIEAGVAQEVVSLDNMLPAMLKHAQQSSAEAL